MRVVSHESFMNFIAWPNVISCSQILEKESREFSSSKDDSDADVSVVFPRTSGHVSCVMERAELLLNVTITNSSSGSAVGRSASNIDKTKHWKR